jgi:predicted HicB family RNase H-like nuclease
MPSLNQKYPIRTEWSDEDDAFVATCAQFPGLVGSDEDETLAVAELREAIDMALEDMAAEGRTPPEPEVGLTYSGQFRLRIPKTLHAQLAQRAAVEEVSLNSLAQTYLACGLASDFTATRAAQRAKSDFAALVLGVPQGMIAHAHDSTEITRVPGATGTAFVPSIVN